MLMSNTNQQLIRTLIIDDEPAIRRDLQYLLARHTDFVEVGACGSIVEGLVLIPATRPDLVLMDIQLSDGISFDLLAQLGDIPFKLIFITAYNDGALKAIKAGALDYILKPVEEEEFDAALAKASTVILGKGNDEAAQLQLAQEHFAQPASIIRRIALRTQQYVELVDITDILYARSDGGYTTFYLTEKRKLLISRPLKEYEELLPDELFMRPHQSYLVQKSFVTRYHRDGILILKDNTEIPVASRRRDAVLEALSH